MFSSQYALERMARDIPAERIRRAENERIALAMSGVAETPQMLGAEPISTSRRLLQNPAASWVLQLIRQ